MTNQTSTTSEKQTDIQLLDPVLITQMEQELQEIFNNQTMEKQIDFIKEFCEICTVDFDEKSYLKIEFEHDNQTAKLNIKLHEDIKLTDDLKSEFDLLKINYLTKND